MSWYAEAFKAALPAVVGGLSQAYATKSQADALKDDRAYKEKMSALDFDRQKELLAFKAGLGGGGGGGGGGGVFKGFTDPQKVSAMQAQQQQELDAINAIIAAYQRAVLA